ncbi:MAG: UDP-glucose 4-epimerase GalE [Pseudomonadota bacterium]
MSTQDKQADRILLTGGAGYIGSHVGVELLENKRAIMILDNFANSSPASIDRIRQICDGEVHVLEADLSKAEDRIRIIDEVCAFNPDGAIHMAGLKAVGESVAEPIRYYQTNIDATFCLIEALEKAAGKSIVFSSSATVYGDLNASPVAEDGATGPTNPYGRTKYFIEEMLKDLCTSDSEWKVCNLRYFNPVGAHSSGLIGEDPRGIPNNLFPYIAQVAVGRREKLAVYGNDYPTQDGTGVRDYIHVVDLARGHLAAIDYLASATGGSVDVNLGTGTGYSVLDAVGAFKRASNRDIPYEITERRPGDVAEIYANPALAKSLLKWEASRGLDQMCADHWNWQFNNPEGYDEG